MESTDALERTPAAAPVRTAVARRFSTLLWVFATLSIVGLAGETLQHWAVFGELESRPGFIWGPFSPIYGLAAVLLSVFLEPLQDKPIPVLILIGGAVGGGLEYFASWAMETYWGVVAWSYLDLPFNFDGRTDLFHCLVWGTLGALWVRIGLPIAQRVFDRIDLEGMTYRVCTAALAIFMAANIAVTVTVLLRADARTHGVAPQNAIEELYDAVYPTDYLQKLFHNMGGIGIR